jgi:glucitol/sorbitol PTS system EIIA component
VKGEVLKYRTRVVSIGDQVDAFIKAQILVLFQAGAPEELASFSVLHQPEVTTGMLEVGDTLLLGSEPYLVRAVGSVANENLRALGHLVVKCNDRDEAELPGDVCVDAKPLVMLAVGDEIRIEGGRAL